jgi:hypothetical protein
MFKDSRYTFDVAGPLEWDLLVGTHAYPAWNGQVDALEIKGVARVGEGGKVCGAAHERRL